LLVRRREHRARGGCVLEELEHLLELSRVDEELAELQEEYRDLPEQVASLEKERAEVREGAEGKEAELESAKKERQKLERQLADLTARRNELEAKRTVIKTNEEYAALTLEIDYTKKQISETEDVILRLLETVEEATSGLAKAREAAAEKEREIDERVAALSAEIAKLDDAVAVKRDERLRAAKRVPAAILSRYELILGSKGDSAMARVVGGACSGCYMKLPPQTVIEVKRSDRFIECQSCGRILYWTREAGSG
jgi:predicted  nucleic acid-binding Zn-ribbon protein